MPALDPATRDRWRGLVVVDRDGLTIGTVTSFYLDRVSGVPTWALVLTGWFTDRTAFVPIRDAAESDGEIQVPLTKAQVRRAPWVETFGGLSPVAERTLAVHYGLHRLAGADAEPAPEPPGRNGKPDAEPETATG
jgi:hypothetical protein